MNPSDCRVLIVDDHPMQRLLLGRMLAALPVREVVAASGGLEALELIENGARFDLVITDLDMPGVDGMELTRRIGELPAPPPVALVSALDAQILASVGTLSRLGGRALLTILPKPVSIDALRTAVAAIPDAVASPHPRGTPSTPRADYTVDEIAAGLDAGQFVPYFEPQIELNEGHVTGFEALVRWLHPRDGVIAPGRFLPQIENTPLMARLTDAVLAGALDAQRGWRDVGLTLSLSVNLSPGVLTTLDFAACLTSAVLDRGLDPKTITFELTESNAANGSAVVLENITRLRIKGFRLSIDDFGTGYSSLQQLSELPLSELKIDRGFTARMLDDRVARAAVESSLRLAQQLGLSTCGEGIEQPELVRQLRWMGCERGQGYLFSRPIAPERVLAWLVDWPQRRGALVEEWRVALEA
ncbi:EAL domain-containing protein [Nevskia sp.]|uniref:EAL domain-containing response regulator n=1 Tax=Nevskia sp. TaxID=1929292 RepID=UPI0025F33071|nr:EAL domain-containing protein [Nevskia sp.]